MKLSIPQLIWEPTAEAVAAARVTGFIQTVNDRTGLALSSYDDLWTYSTEDIAGFWAAVAQYFDIRWHQPPASVLDDPTMPGTRWFPNATLNYAEHALRTPGGADENHLAVLSIREDGSQTELTLTELRSEVGAAQAGLRRLGVGPGDRVVALVPNTVHALIGFLATAALGAVWSSCSPDFGAGSILDRFIQVEPTVLIAVDGYRYGGKSFRTDETVRKLLDALPSLAGAVHIPELDTPTPTGMIGWNELTARRAAPEFTAVPFSAPLWILYSSGTTGLPKPIVHSVGGILLEHLKSLGLQWDIGPGDRFLWFTTTGWMMWNFLIGGLLVGSTVILYDGSPGYPDLTTLWRIVGDHRASVFGVSAAFVTACQKAGVDPSASISLDALRTIGSTGSPLDESGFDWLSGQVGRDLRTRGGRLVRLGPIDEAGLDEREARRRAAARGRYARNATVQGAAAELFKMWAAVVRTRLAGTRGEIVLCLHDELLLHVPSQAGAEAAAMVVDALGEAAARWAPDRSVRFVADVAVIDRWSDAKG